VKPIAFAEAKIKGQSYRFTSAPFSTSLSI
jgi:hypothetical protein